MARYLKKTWVSKNFGRISKSRKHFWLVSKPRFCMVCFYFFESRNFLPKSLGLRFLTRIWAFQRVSDQVYHSPPLYLSVCMREKETKGSLLNDWLLRVLNRTKIRIAKALKKYFYCNRYYRCRHMCSRMVSFPVASVQIPKSWTFVAVVLSF